MSYAPRDILLVSMLFSDATGAKRRPVMVVYDSGDDDLLVAPITSHEPRTATDVIVGHWTEAGLKIASTVRVEKLNTIARSRVIRRLGLLLPADEENVRAVLKACFRSIMENS